MTIEQALKKCALFSGLSNVELEKIARVAGEKQYDEGSTIYKAGDSADEFLILQEGKVVIQINLPQTEAAMSRNISVDVVNPNEIIGWAPLIKPYIHASTTVCLQKAKVLSISGSNLRRLILEDQIIGHEVLVSLIKIATTKLDETRQLLISERSVSPILH